MLRQIVFLIFLNICLINVSFATGVTNCKPALGFGVMLEPRFDNLGLTVTGFIENSTSNEAGLEIGDLIIGRVLPGGRETFATAHALSAIKVAIEGESTYLVIKSDRLSDPEVIELSLERNVSLRRPLMLQESTNMPGTNISAVTNQENKQIFQCQIGNGNGVYIGPIDPASQQTAGDGEYIFGQSFIGTTKFSSATDRRIKYDQGCWTDYVSDTQYTQYVDNSCGVWEGEEEGFTGQQVIFEPSQTNVVSRNTWRYSNGEITQREFTQITHDPDDPRGLRQPVYETLVFDESWASSAPPERHIPTYVKAIVPTFNSSSSLTPDLVDECEYYVEYFPADPTQNKASGFANCVSKAKDNLFSMKYMKAVTSDGAIDPNADVIGVEIVKPVADGEIIFRNLDDLPYTVILPNGLTFEGDFRTDKEILLTTNFINPGISYLNGTGKLFETNTDQSSTPIKKYINGVSSDELAAEQERLQALANRRVADAAARRNAITTRQPRQQSSGFWKQAFDVIGEIAGAALTAYVTYEIVDAILDDEPYQRRAVRNRYRSMPIVNSPIPSIGSNTNYEDGYLQSSPFGSSPNCNYSSMSGSFSVSRSLYGACPNSLRTPSRFSNAHYQVNQSGRRSNGISVPLIKERSPYGGTQCHYRRGPSNVITIPKGSGAFCRNEINM